MKQANFDSWWWRVLCSQRVLVVLWTPGVQEEGWGGMQCREKPTLLMMMSSAAIPPALGKRRRAEEWSLVESLWCYSGNLPVRVWCKALPSHLVLHLDPHAAKRFTSYLIGSVWVFPWEVSHKYFKCSCSHKLWVLGQSWRYLDVALTFPWVATSCGALCKGGQELQEEVGAFDSHLFSYGSSDSAYPKQCSNSCSIHNKYIKAECCFSCLKQNILIQMLVQKRAASEIVVFWSIFAGFKVSLLLFYYGNCSYGVLIRSKRMFFSSCFRCISVK